MKLKVSSLFHWLYCAVMFLPILLLPVFMIYSHRHDINDGTLQVQETMAVDFNQLSPKVNFIETLQTSSNTTGYTMTVSDVSIGDDVIIKFIANVTDNTISNTIRIRQPFVSQFENLYTYDSSYLFRGIVTNVSSGNFLIQVQVLQNALFSYECKDIQYFNLTKMNLSDLTTQEFNSMFPNSYYEPIVSKKMLVDGGLVTYSDTDIMSQATYQLYNAVDKYFNISQFFGFENLWNFMVLYWFGGNVTIYLRIFWQLLTYWLVVSIAWLIFDLFMYVPKLAHRWLDRSALE